MICSVCLTVCLWRDAITETNDDTVQCCLYMSTGVDELISTPLSQYCYCFLRADVENWYFIKSFTQV